MMIWGSVFPLIPTWAPKRGQPARSRQLKCVTPGVSAVHERSIDVPQDVCPSAQ